MRKKYVVRLSDQERDTLREVVKQLKGTSQKVRRAHILLKADSDGPGWTDRRIGEAFSCRTKTVENIRQRLVEHGFQETLNGKRRAQPPTEKLLDGEQEAKVIATRRRRKAMQTGLCGCWLARSSHWKLFPRLVAKRFVVR